MAKILIKKENIKNEFTDDFDISDTIYCSVLSKVYAQIRDIKVDLKEMDVKKTA